MNDIPYIDWFSQSDKALAENIGNYVHHHRLNQNRTQSEVAEAAGISRSTLSLLERGETVTLNSLIRVLRVLGRLEIMNTFSVVEEISPVAYARLKKKERQRARGRGKESTNYPESEW